ncbi:hypothetical protein LTR56_001053 [Elasticomyces elasticus]|nr:hypothetical protein LTR56_001053 [Elasticomyces elasticus]KAK3663454.1 hypothetical protein LTR22_005625 [Elasticomyces elasticus]KAK5768975.1 hypothetical protein LTS12_000688 [Elasticomyces elasticus]
MAQPFAIGPPSHDPRIAYHNPGDVYYDPHIAMSTALTGLHNARRRLQSAQQEIAERYRGEIALEIPELHTLRFHVDCQIARLEQRMADMPVGSGEEHN